MGMFDTYDNINTNYIPDNINKQLPQYYNIIDDTYPKKLYDMKGRFQGFSWNYGDEFEFKLTVNNVIKVNKDSIVYTGSGEYPYVGTLGYKGQQAYNIVDNKSWTCIGEVNGLNLWVEDEEIIYDSKGTKEIEFITDMTNKGLILQIYDFQWEPIKSFENFESTELVCTINKDIYNDIKRGLYYAILYVLEDNVKHIKNKFIISIE